MYFFLFLFQGVFLLFNKPQRWGPCKVQYPLDLIQATGGHHCLQGTDHINAVPNAMDFDIFMLLIQERCEDRRKKNTMDLCYLSLLSWALMFLLSIYHDSKLEMCPLLVCLRLK